MTDHRPKAVSTALTQALDTVETFGRRREAPTADMSFAPSRASDVPEEASTDAVPLSAPCSASVH